MFNPEICLQVFFCMLIHKNKSCYYYVSATLLLLLGLKRIAITVILKSHNTATKAKARINGILIEISLVNSTNISLICSLIQDQCEVPEIQQ